MTSKEEVPEDVLECANLLMALNCSKPTAEEYKKIQLWKNIANAMELTIIPKTEDCKVSRCLDVGTKSKMPYWLDKFIRDNIGVGPKMIIEKSLTATDLNPNNGRLSMPPSQIVDEDFVTEVEKTIKEKGLSGKGLDATIIDCKLRRWEVNLRIWDMSGRPIYNLLTGWNQVVKDINLQEKDNIRLWSFHSNGKLYFALILLPPSTDSGKPKP
ncbi:hypothetical protein HID58_064099 [Brassica napus]|uniref:BnaC05g03740D protein n=2 Tax=Brassica napus TaxID=3708 RepID=A0A078F9U3_BRANA|nr:B3 domain-containing protein At2g24670 [Brassica napus]KAH0876705.1 hypothetical protein HID58_064099 [Brassica napus]CAF1923884.1 unnamed protein product [Brassica napus]CDY10131.1 BnaC05g03740D [Brassica napus]